MKPIFIQLGNGLVYFQRPEPDTASQDPLTDSEQIIIHLYRENEELKSQLEKIKKIIPDLDI